MSVRRALNPCLAAAGLTACAVECIYIYVRGHKACGYLEPVATVDRGGNQVVIEENGAPPRGCACMTLEIEELFEVAPDDPGLDGMYAEIEAEARVRCTELALELSADSAPCDAAMLNKAEVAKTEETYEECKYLGATIDEDKDGYCPLPEDAGGDEVGTETGGTETGDTSTDTDTGSDPVIPDLPLDFP